MPQTKNVAALFLAEDTSSSPTDYDLYIAIPLDGKTVSTVGSFTHDVKEKKSTLSITLSSGTPSDPIHYRKVSFTPGTSTSGWTLEVHVNDGANTEKTILEYADAETDTSIAVSGDKALCVPYTQLSKVVDRGITHYQPQTIVELDGHSFAGEGILFNEQLGVSEAHVVLYNNAGASAETLYDGLRIHQHDFKDNTSSNAGYFECIVVLCSSLAEAAEYLTAMGQVGNANTSASNRPKKKTKVKTKH